MANPQGFAPLLRQLHVRLEKLEPLERRDSRLIYLIRRLPRANETHPYCRDTGNFRDKSALLALCKNSWDWYCMTNRIQRADYTNNVTLIYTLHLRSTYHSSFLKILLALYNRELWKLVRHLTYGRPNPHGS